VKVFNVIYIKIFYHIDFVQLYKLEIHKNVYESL